MSGRELSATPSLAFWVALCVLLSACGGGGDFFLVHAHCRPAYTRYSGVPMPLA